MATIKKPITATAGGFNNDDHLCEARKVLGISRLKRALHALGAARKDLADSGVPWFWYFEDEWLLTEAQISEVIDGIEAGDI